MLAGFPELDHLTGGFSPGDLVFLAARSSMGKMTFALSVASQVAESNEAVVVFSLEKSKEQIVQRLISACTRIPASDLYSGNIQDEEWPQLIRGMVQVCYSPLWVEDSVNLSLREMRVKVEQLANRLKVSGLPLSLK